MKQKYTLHKSLALEKSITTFTFAFPLQNQNFFHILDADENKKNWSLRITTRKADFNFFVLEIEKHRLILVNYRVLAQATAGRGINLKLMHTFFIYNIELD